MWALDQNTRWTPGSALTNHLLPYFFSKWVTDTGKGWERGSCQLVLGQRGWCLVQSSRPAHISGEGDTIQSVRCSVSVTGQTHGGSVVVLSLGRGLCAQHSEGSSLPTWHLPNFGYSMSSAEDPSASWPLRWPHSGAAAAAPPLGTPV